MLAELGLFVLGLALLVVGADRAVTSAGDFALYYGVSPFFIGVTLISIGTSVPEMVTSVYAAYYGAGDLVVGNIVGSETAQITLAIAVVAFIAPFVVERRNVLVYGSAMILATVIMLLTLGDGVIGRSEGFLMMLAYVQFIHTLYTNEGGGEEIAEEVIEQVTTPRAELPWIVGGLALVVGGIAAHKGRGGISVGAILGGNITDPVFSLGIGALFFDVTIPDVAALQGSLVYMLVASVLVLALFYWREGIDRPAAVVCLLLYIPTFLML